MSIKKFRLSALAAVLSLAIVSFSVSTASFDTRTAALGPLNSHVLKTAAPAVAVRDDKDDGCFVMALGGRETCQNDQNVCPIPTNRCIPSRFVEITNRDGDAEFHLFECACDLREPGPRTCRLVQGGWPHTQRARRRDPNQLCVGDCPDPTKDCVAHVVGNDGQGHAVFECRCE